MKWLVFSIALLLIFTATQGQDCPGEFQCNNGQCIPLSWKCDGVTDCQGETHPGSDERDCATSCSSNQYKCPDGECIPLEFKCDGDDDCSDGDDEQACPGRTCVTGEFSCSNGYCIPSQFYCDHVIDCPDSSDEGNDCSYPTCTEESCDNGACYKTDKKCDGNVDCRDESDEFNCTAIKCPSGQFRCDNGKCIPQAFVCDVWDNCGDRSDEPDTCTYPPCPGNTFTCDNHVCVNQEWVCDGIDNCGDGTDEKKCPDYNKECLNNQWKCTNSSQCIDVSQLCDDVIDCDKGEDESKAGTNYICSSTNCGILSCDYRCRVTPWGGICYCGEGMKVSDDGISCEDFDECSIFGQCEQICVNTVGSYKCECGDGYTTEVHDQHVHCKANPVAGAPKLLYAAGSNIFTYDFVNNREDRVVSTASRDPIGVDYHYQMGLLFWADTGHNRIMSSDMNGNNVKTVLDLAIVDPEHVAVDWIANNLYIVETKVGRIDVCNFDGSHRAGIITDGLERPRGLALDPLDGYLFFTDWAINNARLGRAYMDGKNLYTLVDTNMGFPAGITLDLVLKRLFWVDTKFDYLETVDYYGKDRRVILSGSTNLPHPFDVTIFEHDVFITDWTRLGIIQANKFDGSNLNILYKTGGLQPKAIKSYHPVQQPQAENPCSPQNGGCSHLCVLSHSSDNNGLGYRCLCDPGFTLNLDGKTCSAVSSFLLLQSYQSIRGIPVTRFLRPDVMLPILSINEYFMSVTADAIRGYVYYVDSSKRIVGRRLMNATAPPEDVVINGIRYLRSAAIDWSTGNLYMLDGGRNTITVVKTDDPDMRTDLVVIDFGTPYSIALAPNSGYMVWTDIRRPARILRAWMDGSHIEELVNTTIGTPTDVTIDLTSNRVYWADSYLATLEAISLYGHGRTRLQTTQPIIYPSAITFFEDHFYWADNREQKIFRAHELAGSGVTFAYIVREDVQSTNSLYYYDKNLQMRYSENQCNRPNLPNGGCQQLCFPTPGRSRTCGCQFGFQVGVVSTTCVPDTDATHPPTCDTYQFECGNGRCIFNSYQCNGVDDCGDGSDETEELCGGTCPSHMFTCDNGKCLYTFYKCDGDDECGDGSDEKNCPSPTPCRDTLFQCANGNCIAMNWVCDSANDCGDGSDEVSCENKTCNPQQFTCPGNVCIPSYMRCNGYDDCNNGADEDDCPPMDCNPNYLFACSSGTQCISKSYTCDGSPDCRDGSDEMGCPSRAPGQCETDEFQCQTSGVCIPGFWRCDARRDCDDGSDEPPSCPPITCSSIQFQCTNKLCITSYYVCNGRNDCGDNSDEEDCPTPPPTLPPPPCTFNQWECPGTKKCISFNQLCDGFGNCPGNTDEGDFCDVNSCSTYGCTDKCTNLPDGPLCWCDGDGFQLLNDSKTCADIDECSLHYCSQQCDNTEGSFYCECDDGYRLDTDGRTCKVTSDPRILLVSNRNSLYQRNLDTNSLYAPIRSINILAIDFDWQTRRIYYADTTYGYLFSKYLNNTGQKVVFQSGQAVTENVAVDWVGRNLYWCDYDLGTVEVAGLDGNHRVVLHTENVSNPRGLAIDPREGYIYMFWTDWGKNPSIERSSMDGKNRTVIIKENLYWPNGLTLDYPNDMVYFADARLDFIHRCDYNGGQRTEVLANDLSLRHPHSLTVLEDALYWTDRETNSVSGCNKWDGRKDQSTIMTGLQLPTDILAYHPVRQPPGQNYCKNNPCSHLCLLSRDQPGNYACACPVGSQLTDQHTCTSTKEEFLVVATSGRIFGISLDPSDQNSNKMIPVSDLDNGLDVEHDDTEGFIYWVDSKTGSIHRVHINGSFRGVFAASGIIGKPNALAIDWMSRNLYYTNPEGKSIEVIRLDRGDRGETYRRTILSNIGNETGVGKPMGIATDPINGKLYWSDQGADRIPSKISRCDLDGSKAENIVTGDLSGVQHIALDIPSRRIYWAQQSPSKIMSANFDGSDTITLVDNVINPVGIAVLDGYIYYSDHGLEIIERADKTNGENQVVMRDQIDDVTALKVYNRPVGRPNSCWNNKACQQFCFPVDTNGFTCGCSTGFKFQFEDKTCVPYDSFAIVSQQSVVRGFDLSADSHADALTPIGSYYFNCTAIDVDMKTKSYLWSNYYPGGSNNGFIGQYFNRIYSYKADGSRGSSGLVDSGIGQLGVTGLSHDWVGGNVYFINAFTTETYLEVIRIAFKYRVILFKTKEDIPRSIVVNPLKRYLYMADYGQTPKIERALLDGTNRTTIATSGVVSPRGLTVDYATHDVYWVDDASSSIEKVTWDGSTRTLIRSGRNYPAPAGISIFNDKIYWIDSKFKALFSLSKNPSSDEDPAKVRDGLENLQALAIYDKTVQPDDTGNNPCVRNNGGCEQLCYAMPDNTKVCDCSYGKLGTDGVTCEDVDDYLIFSTQRDIQSFHVDPEDHSQIFASVSVTYPISLAHDRVNNRAYFSTNQGSRSRIGYFYLLSTTPQPRYIITSGLQAPEGLDFDWKHNRLYYTDNSLKTISSCGVDGNNVTTLLTGLDKPRAIAVDPCSGYMYWTDWGTVSKIERATLAGGSRTTIIGTDLYWPNGLTIDFDEGMMYWVDAEPGQERIERSDLDGNNREMVLRSYDHPFAITVLDQFVYWTDWSTNAVYRANKEDGGSITTMRSQLSSTPMDVIGYSSRQQQECKGYNPCNRFNGGCSHICTVGPNYLPECSCPEDDGNNYYLANNKKECIVDNGQDRCSDNRYTCPNGDCIPKVYVCDTFTDCQNGVDESERVCADNSCPSNEFRCPSGRCIPISWVCDYDNDCGDGSDEDQTICDPPTCATNEFECATGRCISPSLVCNGRDDCRDGSVLDEKDCPDIVCGNGYHKCVNTNICIPVTYLCDGDNDCQDNTDENPLYCVNKTCTSDRFQCADKHKCIPFFWYCDGSRDCDDGSDEPADCKSDVVTCPSGAFKCDNGRCIDEDWICDGENDCNDNSDEDDRHDCANRECPEDNFKCLANPSGSNRCIPQYQVCDGDPDCQDASDELLPSCQKRNCTGNEFTCKNGLCIRKSYECDHSNDCGDFSDEYPGCVYGTCNPTYQFTCENGKCIYWWEKCDGLDDCGDNSDEDGDICPTGPPTCASGQFRCTDGQCIDESLVCDREPDCDDKSDEPPHCGVNECLDVVSNQCAQNCVDTPTSYYCACDDGYRLMSDGKACEDINECIETPSVCSQLCDNLDGSYYCKCANGYLREPDGKTCRQNSGIDPYLLFSNRYYIRSISTDGSNYQLISQGHDTIVALDVHFGDKRMFWTDVSRGSIETMKFDGSERKVLFDREVPNAEGLAVEWITRKLYWLDATLDAMFVSELNGTSLKTLLSGCIDVNRTYCFDQPRAIVVHPRRGYVFWTDYGVNAFIGRAGLNGINAAAIITSRISWPQALTIDYVTERLYWGDAHIDVIEFCDMNGDNRNILDMREKPPHPFSMAFFESYIYWTDWNTLSLYKAHALEGSDLQVLVNTTHRPFDVHVIHPYRQDSHLPNPCENNNGGCSHLCLMYPGGQHAECHCPDNFVSIHVGLNSNRCVPACTSAQYRCDSTEKCIPIYWQCDGVKDCPDGSDEPESCPPRHCDIGYLQCNNFNCILPEYRCDGKNDCGDNSDEINCDDYPCLENQFKCSNGNCLNSAHLCNGLNDCGDGSDEEEDLCKSRTCPGSMFQCNNGRCIPDNWFCDVDDDCGDGSDEPTDFCHGPGHRCDEHNEFACETTYRCIPSWAVCNGIDDCYDNSDEKDCSAVTCHPTGDFRCDNHRCIPMRWKCDGFNDCGDGSDEISCPPRQCTESEFRCDNQQCIPSKWVCNQFDECGDGSDERSCPARTCLPNYFECDSGHCVPLALTCDGDRDCLDASDEVDCLPKFPGGKYCPPNVFECDNHVCVNPNFRCDGYDHCGDGSDEYPSVCESIDCDSPNFRCEKTRICIFWTKLCDGNDDCGDGSDETLDKCYTTTPSGICQSGEFKCLNKQCIPETKICDDVDDCGDMSDEIGCSKGETNLTCSDKPCEQICTQIPSAEGRPGFYLCSCDDGFRVNAANTHTCLDIDECSENWDACPQICNNFKGYYQCDCEKGYEKSGVNECSVGDFSLHLIANEERLETYDEENDREGLLIDGQLKVYSLDYAYIEGNNSIVLWTDTAKQNDGSSSQIVEPRIMRSLMPYADASTNNMGRAQQLNIADLKHPSGIAVDWVTRNMYWTDSEAGTLSVSLLDGRYRFVLFRKLDTPHAIAVSPKEGFLYWSSIGLTPAVYRSHMDGGEMMKLDKLVVAYPTGITIDYQHNGRLYICDEEGDVIISTNRHGGDYKIVARGGLGRPVSIDVFESSVYWTSVQDRALYRIDKFGRGVKTLAQEGFSHPTNVKIFSHYKYETTVSARCKPGSCSHLCLLSPGSYSCACPEGTNFVPGSARQCDASYEAEVQPLPVCECRNGGSCLYDNDGTPSCACSVGFSGRTCEIQVNISSSSTGDAGVIAGVVVAVLFVILIIIGAYLFLRKSYKSIGDLPLPTSCPSCCRGRGLSVSYVDNPIMFKNEEEGIEYEIPQEAKPDENKTTNAPSTSLTDRIYSVVRKTKRSTATDDAIGDISHGLENPGFRETKLPSDEANFHTDV